MSVLHKRKREYKKLFNIKPVEIEPDSDKPLKGREIIPERQARIFLAAHTTGGKTTVINHLLKTTIDKRTEVFIFCRTYDTDKTWIAIIDWLKEKEFAVHTFKDIKVGGQDILQPIMAELRQKDIEEKREKDMPPKAPITAFIQFYKEDEEKIEEEKHYKTSVPKRIFILDDQSRKNLRSTSLVDLIKESRHGDTRVIISSQHLIHLEPDAFDQLSEVLLFPGFSKHYIDMIADRVGGMMSHDQFWMLYNEMTNEDYSFMTVYKNSNEVRQKFNLPAINLRTLFRDDDDV